MKMGRFSKQTCQSKQKEKKKNLVCACVSLEGASCVSCLGFLLTQGTSDPVISFQTTIYSFCFVLENVIIYTWIHDLMMHRLFFPPKGNT